VSGHAWAEGGCLRCALEGGTSSRYKRGWRMELHSVSFARHASSKQARVGIEHGAKSKAQRWRLGEQGQAGTAAGHPSKPPSEESTRQPLGG